MAASIGATLPPLVCEVLAAAVPRRLGAGLRVAALERRLQQDPTDVARRASAVAHYCREATPAVEGGEAELKAIPLARAQEHLEYVLNATDDIHRLHDVLTRAVTPRLFYQMPETVARYMWKIGRHRECLEEFDTRSEFEERATQYHVANALAVLKAADRWDVARELYEEAKALEWNGRRPVRWRKLEQTPGVYIEGLTHLPYWDGAERPALADVLEEHWSEIAEDLKAYAPQRSSRKGWFAGAGEPQIPAYPNLVEESDGGGVWDMLQLYHSRKWHEEACELLPRTARLLQQHLPSADVPYVHYNTEEVVLFLLAPGSRVRLHNGGSNAPLNLHLGISGCEGAHLEVAGEARALRDGAAVCFDDGTDHRVWHTGSEERWVMTVRLMHPELAKKPATHFGRAFTRRTCFETWDANRATDLASRPDE